MSTLFAHATKAPIKGYDSLSDIPQILAEILPAYGGHLALRYDDGKTYRSVDCASLHRLGVAATCLLGGLAGEDQLVLATLTRNRPEWDALAHACLYTGNILAPLDTKMNERELGHLLDLARPDLVLASRAQVARLRRLLGGLEGQAERRQTRILVADLYRCFEDQGVEPVAFDSATLSLREALEPRMGSWLPAPSPRLDDPDTPLAYYATSGTTALPKLVVISNRNIVAEVAEGIDVLSLRPGEEVLSVGPRTHIATLVEFLVTAVRGYPVAYFTREPDEDGVLEAEIAKLRRRGAKIKGLMGVPKLWIHLYKEVMDDLKAKPMMRGLFDHLRAIERHGTLSDIGTLEKAKLAVVRNRLKERLGGHFAYGVSSSAKLDASIVRVFGKLGITLLDVYGATEACGIISRNRLDDLHPGTCGRLIRSLDYRVVGERRIPGLPEPVGELQIRGPTVALGYLGQAPGGHLDADEWFATGDLAWIDEGRIVHLVGRARELIEWADGRLVDPMHLSNLLARSIFVKDALVTRLAPHDDHLSVFLYPDRKRVEADAAWRNEREAGVGEDQALRRRLVEAVDYAQSIIGPVPRLGSERIYLLERPLERTPTHKIKLLFELERLDTSRFI